MDIKKQAVKEYLTLGFTCQQLAEKYGVAAGCFLLYIPCLQWNKNHTGFAFIHIVCIFIERQRFFTNSH